MESEVTEPILPDIRQISNSEKLRSYTRLKLGIAGQLRGLMEIFKKRASETRFKKCEELMGRLADDRFTLAVLGQFKRGKSSLMNAIIGRELLPVGILPLTSAITVLKFGPVERLVIRRQNSVFSEIEPVNALTDFVTERGNPGNCKRIQTATLEVPLPFLRRGLEFVDTPGIGSTVEANTTTTHEFLPECDAALFVTAADSPLTNAELDFLRSVREHARKIFFVLNKMDLIADENQRQEIVGFISQTLRQETDTGQVRVFPVSARLALKAKIHRDGAALESSGLNVLAQELAAFLSREKASVFLSSIIDRAGRLLDEESGEVELANKAAQTPGPVRERRLEEIRSQFKRSAEERAELFARLRDHLACRVEDALAPEIEAFLASKNELMSRHVQRLVSRGRWIFGAEICDRCDKFLLERIRKQMTGKLRQWANEIDFNSDEIVIAIWKKIATGVNRLPHAAAIAFEFPLSSDDREELPWRFEFKVESPLMWDQSWQPRLMFLRSYLPAVIQSRALAKYLKSECAHLIVAVRTAALALVKQSTVDSLRANENEMALRASEIESRIEAAITGTPPPRQSQSQGMEIPERLDWGQPAFEAIRRKLAAFRAEAMRLADLPGHDECMDKPVATAISVFATASDIKPPKFRRMEMDVVTRLRGRGCPVCNYLEDVVFNFLAKTQYDLYLDEEAQAGFAATRGFCSMHMWQLHAVSSPLGESVGLAWLVRQTSDVFALSSKAPEPQAAVSALLPGTNECCACNVVRGAEREFAGCFATFLIDAANQQAYSRSQGVCLRHLFALIEAVSSEETTRFLLKEAAHHFGEIAEDMESYAMKRMATLGPLTNSDENDASMRALMHLAGQKTSAFPGRLTVNCEMQISNEREP